MFILCDWETICEVIFRICGGNKKEKEYTRVGKGIV